MRQLRRRRGRARERHSGPAPLPHLDRQPSDGQRDGGPPQRGRRHREARYSCPLSEFVEQRKALAQTLRKAGRKDDAAKVAAASKPTPAALAVNQLARRHPEEMAELMAVGERLRALVRSAFTGHGHASAMSEARLSSGSGTRER